MKEVEWLNGNNLAQIVGWLLNHSQEYVADQVVTYRHQKASDRKLRLFAIAVSKMIGAGFGDSGWVTAIEQAEEQAAGVYREQLPENFWVNNPDIKEAIRHAVIAPDTVTTMTMAINFLKDIIGDPYRHQSVCGDIEGWPRHSEVGNQCKFCQRILQWQNQTPIKIANDICTSGDFSSTPILADALEEAGCNNKDIIRHLRNQETPCPTCYGSGRGRPTTLNFQPPSSTPPCQVCGGLGFFQPIPHASGCWAIDLVLGLS